MGNISKIFLSFLGGFFLFSSNLLAAGPGAEFISYYGIILSQFGLSKGEIELWIPVFGALFTLAVLVGIGLSYKRSVEHRMHDEKGIAPEERFSLNGMIKRSKPTTAMLLAC